MKPTGCHMRAHSTPPLWQFLSTALALAFLIAAPSAAYAEVSPLVLTEDPAIQAMAAQTYADQFNVSLPVAYARVALQDATAPLVKDLTDAIGADFGGAWYDAEDGGKLKLAVAEDQSLGDSEAVDAAQEVLADAGKQADVEFVHVDYSLDELMDARKAVGDELATQVAAENAEVTVDAERNAIVIQTANDLTAADDAAVASAVSEADTPIVVQQTDESTFHAEDRSCAFLSGSVSSSELFCDPPLRGGIYMQGGTEGCTAGFLVFGNTGGNPFVLTAGHCLTGANGAVWNTRFADSSLHSIGAGHSKVDNASGDFGIIGVENPSGWSATSNSRIWVAGVPGQTTQDSFYSITTAQYAPDWLVVCNTSALPLPNGYHGSCGTVQPGYYSNAGRSAVKKVSGMCAVNGSSGGPVFKFHIAYGVVSSSGSGYCPTYYQPAPNAMTASNVHLG
ncbi:MAG: hypothetical protein WA418_38575 [Bradyrhizobium sp.]